MKKYVYLLLLLFPTYSFCQLDSNAVQLALKLDVTSLLPSHSGTSVRVGIEKLRATRSLYYEIGAYFPSRVNHNLDNPLGFTGKIELKHPDQNDYRSYSSVEVFYKWHSYGTSDSISGIPRYLKEYSVNKHVLAFNGKVGGMNIHTTSGLLIEGFLGLGIRFKYATNTLSSEENSDIISESDYDIERVTNRAGFFVNPNITLGIKIGYLFK